MADIFEPVTLTWEGQDYTVLATRCMRLAYVVEMALRQDSRLSIFELLENPPLTALAMAYAAALRFAGAVQVRDEQVYLVLARGVTGPAEEAARIRDTLDGVLGMLLPPEVLRGPSPAGGADEAAKKTTGG